MDDTATAATKHRRGKRRAPSTAAPVALRKELVENQMYVTAASLFARRGFAGTSLQNIADEMGVTRPALYYYVKSKDDLLARLVAEVTAGDTAQVCEVAADSTLDPVVKLSRIAEIMALSRALQPARFLLLSRSEAALPEDLAAVHETTKRVMLRTLTGVISDGVDCGSFRPVNPRSAALQIIGMCNWIAFWFHEDDPDHATLSAEAIATDVAGLAVSSLMQSSERSGAATGPRAAVDLLRQDLSYLERLLNEQDQRRDTADRPSSEETAQRAGEP